MRAFIRRYSVFITAFLIPVLLMLAIFIVRGVYPFGDRSFLHVDMYHQYFPFLTEFYHKLKEGDSLFFSWNTGLGSNFLALFVYYLASPFNWLCIFVPESLLIEFQTYLVVLKIGLAGLTCCCYFRYHFQRKTPVLAFFSTFYALSGFMAAYNWNVMWLDVVVLAPVIILGLERLVSEGRYRLYCLALATAILSNYYLCIMLCIYLVLYFLLVLLPAAPRKIQACRQFAFSSLLAGSMSAVLLLPELAALGLTEFGSLDFPSVATSYFPIFDVISRHCMDVAVEIGLDHWPNLYCGVAVLVLVPLYILCKSIPSREKIGKLALLSLLLISFSGNTLNFLWHGLNYPNSLPARQSFLYILLVLTLSLDAFLRIREVSKKDLSQVFAGVVIFLILCEKMAVDDALTNRTFLLTLGFLLVYAILFWFYRNRQQLTFSFLLIAMGTIMLEAGLNTFLTSCPTVSRSHYLAEYDSYKALKKRVTEFNPDFVRYERYSRITNNDGMLFGYPSASYFSSTGNGLVNAFFQEYGMRTSKVFYSFDGATALTRALWNVPYVFAGNEEITLPFDSLPLSRLADREGSVFLFETSARLPFGYFVPALSLEIHPEEVAEDLEASLPSEEENPSVPESEPSIHDLTELFVDSEYAAEVVLDEALSEDRERLTPLVRQNQLAKRLGADRPLFVPYETQTSDDSSLFSVTEDGYYYGYCRNDRVREARLQILSPWDLAPAEKTFLKLQNPYILDMGYRKAGEELILTTNTDENPQLDLYRMDETVLKELIAHLSRFPLKVTEFTSTKITGSIHVDETGYLILSMPYEPGWRIQIDGRETNAQLFEGVFPALVLTPGDHEIQLRFIPRGLLPGLAVSALSLLIFILTSVVKIKRYCPRRLRRCPEKSSKDAL